MFAYRPNGLISKHTEYPPIPYGDEDREVVRYDERGLPTYERTKVWDDNYIGHLNESMYNRYDGRGAESGGR